MTHMDEFNKAVAELRNLIMLISDSNDVEEGSDIEKDLAQRWLDASGRVACLAMAPAFHFIAVKADLETANKLLDCLAQDINTVARIIGENIGVRIDE